MQRSTVSFILLCFSIRKEFITEDTVGWTINIQGYRWNGWSSNLGIVEFSNFIPFYRKSLVILLSRSRNDSKEIVIISGRDIYDFPWLDFLFSSLIMSIVPIAFTTQQRALLLFKNTTTKQKIIIYYYIYYHIIIYIVSRQLYILLSSRARLILDLPKIWRV